MRNTEKNRALRREQLMEHIAAVTTPMILKEGYEALTIRDICAGAGITTGMFYRHFVSKDDVLSYCYMQILREMLAGVDKKLRGLTLPQQLVTLTVEVLKINRSFGPGSAYMFLNRRTLSTSGSFQMREMLVAKHRELIDTAVAAGYRLSEGRNVENIYYDISTVSKGLMTDWYMTGWDDIVPRAEELLSRLVPHLL